MLTNVIVVVVLVAALLAAFLVTTLEDRKDNEAWETYLANEESAATRIFARAARPLANLPLLQDQVNSTKTYRNLEAKLRGGGAFGGSLEIFLAVQGLMIAVAVALLGTILILDLRGFWMYMAAAFSALLLVYPYATVHSTAKARAAAVTDSLPDFAELLTMVLPNTSIMTALAFTAERSEGPVAEEVRALVSSIQSRTLVEQEAFRLAADRLGTAEAQAFITTLMNAYLEGTKALEAITAQAEAMRKVAFQERRAAAKRLPTKLILIFGMHFMPALFVVAFLPLALGIGRTLG